MAPLSVIMAVRDGAPYLSEAIASVTGQSTAPADLIVVDDGSTDGSAEIAALAAPSATVARLAPSGYAAAVNHGISLAATPYLAFLDADDLWTTKSLACRIQRLEADDAPDVVVGGSRNFLSPDLSETERSTVRIQTRSFQAEILPACLIRREAFERVGPLDEGLRTGSAIDWISRARAAGATFAHVEDLVLRRRIHRSNLGRTEQASRNAELLRIVRAHHDRRQPT